ncbi:MAG: NERD domain-containing protein/DEAD/DEAH box helicase [Lamprobacter sp.]|uniref:nuclease-related domain-containing DEAD/DEAH box helicase n=1 Tax=Lamprobacter sp. TaxID=3100796 RepID=UPI002B25AE57|nr:NERD domain-containing protein/DEAD/DEAH box helicase [Lamprobacter sp.]MEA3640223.1 NERD domain-containing protein/DEAD/DEAH box helicase [Lamprobacter sp.]
MAVLIPDTPKSCPHGERIVYEKFGRDLDDNWIVLHSLGLTRHPTKLWGEIDLVILSTEGVFAIEIKGGHVSCQDGIWTYGYPGNESYTRREDPWTQAKSAMFALKRRLVEVDPLCTDLLYGYGVIMPHVHFAATGPELESAVLLDKREFGLDLNRYIGTLKSYWSTVYRERHGSQPRRPSQEDIRHIRAILRPNVESTLSLGSWFTGLEQELLQLTNGQIKAARGLDNNPRTIIRGRAGTGKTIIAIDRARRLAAAGHDVLYLCFNRMLADHVRISLSGDECSSHIRVRNIHSLFREAIAEAGLNDYLNRQKVEPLELFGRVFPELFVEAAFDYPSRAADVLIVDEAQDLMTGKYLEALDLLVRDGLRHGRWHMFLDPMQNIYGTEATVAEARLRDAGFAEYELRENCRNTRQVATQCSIISGIDIDLNGTLEGPECDCLYFTGPEALLPILEEEVTRLLASDVAPHDIVILSTHPLSRSSLAGVEKIASLPLLDMTFEQNREGLQFSSMHAFKGLERNVVLAIDLDYIGEDHVAMLHYAGLSRARLMLRVFVDSGKQQVYAAQAKSFGRRLVGSGSRTIS